MATTTKQNNQFYVNGPSIDANIGPWSSISAYTSWLTNDMGLETPYEGTEIQVKDSTGKITKYRYEIISGGATWVEEATVPEYKGIATNADNLDSLSDYGFYYLRSAFLKGFLSVSWDFQNCPVQHLLANQKPVYENGSISEYVVGPCFLSRRYTSGAWTEWTDASQAAAASAAAAAASAADAESSANSASSSATNAQNAATSASGALTSILTAISGLDPSTSTEDAIVALTAQVAAVQAQVDLGCRVVEGQHTYNSI